MFEIKKIPDFFDEFIDSKSNIDTKKIYFDFHVHSPASDGFNKIEFFENFLEDKKHLIAISDHNAIAGSVELYERNKVNIIPAIEIGAEDGFEILAYFKKIEDLEDFYKNKLEAFRHKYRMTRTNKDAEYYLKELKEYECFLSIPHINGMANKNFLKNKSYIYEIINQFDAIETYNHSIGKKRNTKALGIRQEYNKFATFGSDAHTNSEVISYYKKQNEEFRIYSGISKKIYNSYALLGILSKHIKFLIKGKNDL